MGAFDNTIELERLLEPFGPSDMEWRVQRAGEKDGKVWAMLVPYITNRAIQDRLDDVCGPANWRNAFREGPGGGVLCGLSIRLGGEWVTKWDGAENTDIEAVKGGLSGAMKRAGVQWGIGRYLYRLDEAWANVHDRGALRGSFKSGDRRVYFKYDPPDLPAWALPDGDPGDARKVAGERVDTTTGEVMDEPADTESRTTLAGKVEELEAVGLTGPDAKTLDRARTLASEGGPQENVDRAIAWATTTLAELEGAEA